MLENLDKIMHLRFNFDACPMHSPSGFVHLTHQNLSARALFCLNSLAKVNTQLLIYKYHWGFYMMEYHWGYAAATAQYSCHSNSCRVPSKYPHSIPTCSSLSGTASYESRLPGGTQIWVRQGCAARASKPLPIFKGDFGRKGYPFLRIFLEK